MSGLEGNPDEPVDAGHFTFHSPGVKRSKSFDGFLSLLLPLKQ
jgi:hypothetical protein